MTTKCAQLMEMDMSTGVTSAQVAKEFLELAKKEEKNLTPLQLIKLTYLAHGWAYPYLGRLLVDEPVEAWKFGPVFPKLYHALKRYGRGYVDEIPIDEEELTPLVENEKKLIKAVYNGYKHLSGMQLSALTHKNGTPWNSTSWKIWSNEIDPALIREHYEEKMRENKERAAAQA